MAAGSGATAAGLVRALGPERVLAVDTGAVDDPEAVLRHLLGDEGVELRLDRVQVGSGYEHPQPSVLDAVRQFLRSEGIVLEVTYAGRAAAALLDHYRSGDFAPDDRVVFVHTGGVPGLFGHPGLGR
ncbi:pyridoxal-phosphate dependent enzyme [Curtobacterium sp. 9128]|uniref:pyridoxal-phosphate dependent enzyme n=1 Tax=Curtobacterium sp. 9128 TaxID=1793722 RepID=UPI001642545C|nr:pyridoxal-phosphate dependent enzyme [Curtobacterium sp. 9128]